MNTFRKLPDGNWGVMSDAEIKTGTEVVVTLKGGSTKKVTVGDRVGTYQDKILYAVARKNGNGNGNSESELLALARAVVAAYTNDKASGDQWQKGIANAIIALNRYIELKA